MGLFLDQLGIEAARHGFMLIPSADPYTYLVVPYSKREGSKEVVEGMTCVMQRLEAKPQGDPLPNGEVWTTLQCVHDMTLYNFMFMKDPFRNRDVRWTWQKTLVVIWFIHGCVVAPGWWKAASVLIVPPFFFSIDAVWTWLTR